MRTGYSNQTISGKAWMMERGISVFPAFYLGSRCCKSALFEMEEYFTNIDMLCI